MTASMRRLAQSAALAVLLLPAVALGGDERAEFEFRYGGDDPALRSEVTRALAGRLATVAEHLGDSWDVPDAGPLDIVLRATRLHAEHPEVGTARVVIRFDDPGVPSSGTAVRELGRRLTDHLEDWVEGLAQARHSLELAQARSDHDRDATKLRLKESDLAGALRDGDPSRSLQLDTARLAKVHARLGELEVRVPVVRRQLEGARAATIRAAEAVQLEQEVEEFRRQMRATDFDSVRAEIEERLAPLRARLQQLQSESPPLEVARRRAFDLEDELLGIETELELLHAEYRDLSGRIAAAEERVAALEIARERVALRRAELTATSKKLDAVLARPPQTVFELVRPVHLTTPDRR